MQPYFMPYLGYWQLLNAVDKYVIYDDVNYIKGGWINRNCMLLNGKKAFFNLPLLGASPNKHINEIAVNGDYRVRAKIIRQIEAAYRKAPYFKDIFPMISEIYMYESENLALHIKKSIEMVVDYLNIKTELLLSSDIEKNNELSGEDKVIDICKKLGATEYYNAIGGRELYSFNHFKEYNIKLNFLRMNEVKYKQYENEFVDNLSIMDVLMFNDVNSINEMLMKYSIIDA